jgi:DNA-directed RNA polymerase specialized sigma24 family protein
LFDEISSDPFARGQVLQNAQRLRRIALLCRDDRCDIEQELWLALVKGLRRYDQRLGTRNALVVAVLKRAGAEILRFRRALKRRGREDSLESLLDKRGEVSELAAESIGGAEFELRHDVDAVIEGLPPSLSDLAKRLMRQTATEIARETGVDRSTVYRGVVKMRKLFEQKDLQDFL